MKYLVTQEIESPSKVNKYIEVADFFFCLTYMAIAVTMATYVHEYLKIIYFVYSFAFSIFLTSKSTFNKNRRNYESIILMLRHDTNVYHAVYPEDAEEAKILYGEKI